jgi:hypothetical protein
MSSPAGKAGSSGIGVDEIGVAMLSGTRSPLSSFLKIIS